MVAGSIPVRGSIDCLGRIGKDDLVGGRCVPPSRGAGPRLSPIDSSGMATCSFAPRLKWDGYLHSRLLNWAAAHPGLPCRWESWVRDDGFMAQKMNVESFNLDHTTVAAPFVRVADVKHLPVGDTLTKYDVRFCQPNHDHLEMPAVHSIEHSFAECVRNHSESVIDFGPMGCQTGFYLIMVGEPDVPAVCDLVETTFRDILELDATPAANEVQCGWGANHSIDAAQEAVRTMLDRRDEWEQVTA